jgi:hypothetical protein
MANNALIQGAALTAKKFVDVGEAVGKGFSMVEHNQGTPETVKKNDHYQNRVNEYMSKMKTGMDFSSFSNSETATMRNFLMSERAKYADAAKNIAKIDDATSPEYMEYVDTMNSVNNSFTNLAEQLKAYKKGKLDYAKDQIDNSLSKGMDPEHNKQSMIMYGFYDGDHDKKSDAKYDAPFKILDGGNIGFDIDGKTIPYNDAPVPVYKDYELANGLLKSNESVYKAGVPLTKMDMDMYRVQLEQSLQNPNSLKSIVYDFDGELNTKDIANMWDANKDKEGMIDTVRNQVIDRLMKARTDVANEGIAEKKRKEQDAINKAINRKNALRSHGSGRSSSSNSNSNLSFSPAYKGADGKYYVHQLDANGKEIGAPIYDEKTTKDNSQTVDNNSTINKKTPPTVKKQEPSLWEKTTTALFGTGKKK